MEWIAERLLKEEIKYFEQEGYDEEAAKAREELEAIRKLREERT